MELFPDEFVAKARPKEEIATKVTITSTAKTLNFNFVTKIITITSILTFFQLYSFRFGGGVAALS